MTAVDSATHSVTDPAATAAHSPSSAPPSLPLVVQAGFAGARSLWPDGAAVDPQSFERALARQLREALAQLPQALGLSPQHFLVGLSQVAAGADMLFTEAIAELGWKQRVFLPQLREDYLAAQGSRGPDFSPAEQARARALLALPHVIEECVVTTAADRAARFDDANLQILAESDVLVCLYREDQTEGRPGGTLQLMERARARRVPLLALCVALEPDGSPRLTAQWTLPPAQGADGHPTGNPTGFVPPRLPAAVQAPDGAPPLPAQPWPSVPAYAEALKARASLRAGRRRIGFEQATLIIIGTHVVATLLATLVNGLMKDGVAGKLLLLLEMALLGWGLYRHHQLHHENHTEDWAMARLCAELARSVLAYRRLQGSLQHLLALPVPPELKPVLRTLNVLQLCQLRHAPRTDWAHERDRYVALRLGGEAGTVRLTGSEQIDYYDAGQRRAERLVKRSSDIFSVLSVVALAATTVKLAWKLAGVQGAPIDWAGLAAVVLPVMAVGAMSYAAALDAEARAHTFQQMQLFLRGCKLRLQGARSPREVAALAAETEARLFGETVLWYSRRAYTSVA